MAKKETKNHPCSHHDNNLDVLYDVIYETETIKKK